MTQRYTWVFRARDEGGWVWLACVWSGLASLPSLLLPRLPVHGEAGRAPAFVHGGGWSPHGKAGMGLQE